MAAGDGRHGLMPIFKLQYAHRRTNPSAGRSGGGSRAAGSSCACRAAPWHTRNKTKKGRPEGRPWSSHQSQRSGLNRRPLDYESSALPLSYAGNVPVPHRTAIVHALARTRTATPCGTTPSRWRVYQFHHQGDYSRDGRWEARGWDENGACQSRISKLSSPTSNIRPLSNGSDGARTRDLSSDSRVL